MLTSESHVACIFAGILAMASGCSETQEGRADDAGLLDIAAEPRPSADVGPPDGSGETDRSATPDVATDPGASVSTDVATDPDASVSTDVATPLDGVGLDSNDSGVSADGVDADGGSCPTDSIWETSSAAFTLSIAVGAVSAPPNARCTGEPIRYEFFRRQAHALADRMCGLSTGRTGRRARRQRGRSDRRGVETNANGV